MGVESSSACDISSERIPAAGPRCSAGLLVLLPYRIGDGFVETQSTAGLVGGFKFFGAERFPCGAVASLVEETQMREYHSVSYNGTAHRFSGGHQNGRTSGVMLLLRDPGQTL